MEELRAKTAQLREEANRLNLTNAAGAKRYRELETQIKANTSRIRDFDRSLSGSGTLVGEYGLGIQKAFMKIGTAVAASYGAVKVFKAVIESADSSSDDFARTMSSAKFALDLFLKSIATGDFTNFFENMEKAIRLGADYEDQLDDIGNRTRALSIRESELEFENAKLLRTLRSATTTQDDAVKAGTQILANDKEIAELKTSIANQALKARIESLGMLDISEENLKQNLVLYEQNRLLIEQADEYNENLKSRQKLTLLYQNTTIPLTEKEKQIYADLTETINNTNEDVIKFAKLRSTYTKLNEKELDGLVILFREVFIAQQFEFDNNSRAAIKLASLLDQRNKKETESSEDRIKGLKDENKAYEDLMDTQRKYLTEFFGFKEEKAFKPVSKTGLIKQTVPGIGEDIERFKAEGAPGFLDIDKRLDEEEKLKRKRSENIKKYEQMTIQSLDFIYGYKKNQLDRQMAAELAGAAGNEQKTLEIKKRYARRQQELAVTQTIIKGIVAIATIFADLGWPAGIIPSLIMAGETAAEVSAIKSQKFAKSGRIHGGLRVKPDARGDDTLVVAKQGEVILNDRHQAALGGAQTFKRLGVPGFADSGMVGASNISYQPSLNFDVNQMARAISNSINDQRVTLVMSELEEAEHKLQIIKSPGKF
jgi:hypothetical protein